MGNNINWGSIYKKTNFGKGVTNATNGWGSIYANLVSGISGILSSLKSVGTYYENEEATEETLNSLEKCKILEKATILITPTSYGDGILHAAKPENGSADLDLVRGSAATRTNADGNVDSIDKLGVEINEDVEFNTPSDWNLTGQSVVENGKAHILQSDSSNTGVTSNTKLINKKYLITGVISDYVEGSVRFTSLGSTSSIALPQENGTFSIEYTSTRSIASDWNIQRLVSPVNLKLDNVSVKEVIDVTNIPRIDYTGGVGHILLEGQATQLYENTETLSTQDNTTTAQDYSVSFYGTGTVTLSGAYTGTLAGTGVNERVTLKFTSTAATLTSTVSGTVTKGQLEVGDASSYIPNTTGSATRLAESLSRGGLSGLINSEEGVLYFKSSLVNDGEFGTPICVSVGNETNNFILIYKTSSNLFRAIIRKEGVSYEIDSDVLAEGIYSVALSYEENNCKLYVDGLIVGSLTTVELPIGLNTLHCKVGSDINPYRGDIYTLGVFPTLTSTELQCLTTQS